MAAQDRPHKEAPLLIIPATYQSGVVGLILCPFLFWVSIYRGQFVNYVYVVNFIE